MTITNPTLITDTIASTNGTLTAAQQIKGDASAFTGNLEGLSDTVSVQTLMAAIDGWNNGGPANSIAMARIGAGSTNYTGVLTGTTHLNTALERLDALGIGAPIFIVTSSYTAQNSNISEWFGGRQQTRIRFTDDGPTLPPTFTLPGATALNTAFDQLVTAGLPEVIRFIIEYTGPAAQRINIVPRNSDPGTPQIMGISRVLVSSGTFATLEITRTNSVISNYIFQSQGGLGDTTGSAQNEIRLINPAQEQWDASASGTLPSTALNRGNAWRVTNAPASGEGRFGEPMQDGDWVVIESETLTSWSTTPHGWFVIPAHEVRRISALENDFLSGFVEVPVSDRNQVIRGADYADEAGEIRLKLYPARSDYSAADLHTTGDVDEYTNPTALTGYLGVRFVGTQSTLASTLSTLYAYKESSSGEFTLLGNISRHFPHQGDYTTESDYLSLEAYDYEVGDTIRIYVGETIARYNSPHLDVEYDNLSDELQARVDRQEPWFDVAQTLFGGATVRHDRLAAIIRYQTGYSRAVDWRDMAQSTTVNADRYISDDLTITADHVSFEVSGFGVGLRKIIAVQLQRNDANNSSGAMIEAAPGVALMRVNSADNKIQFNTTPGSGVDNWTNVSTGVGPAGDFTLASGTNNFLIFEMNPLIEDHPDDRWDVVAGFYDGVNYREANNFTVTVSGTVTGDHLGFSRSVNQRGQILRFSAIKSPGYLTHDRLNDLLEHNRDDKWNHGFARQIVAATDQEVVFTCAIEIDPDTGRLIITAQPNGTRVMLVADDSNTNNIKLGLQEI